MKTTKRTAMGLASVVGSLTLACGAVEESPTTAATPVRVIEATGVSRDQAYRTSGTLALRSEMNLTFKIPGFVGEVLVDEGDRVRAGQVLARLQTTEADAQLRAAEAQADLAAKTHGRMARLLADSVISAAQLDAATDAHERAQAGLAIARYNRDHATIRAPSAGRILRRSVEVAEFAAAGMPVFRFGSSDRGWVVRVGVPDHALTRIGVGSEATVVLPALADTTLMGQVLQVSDAADPRSGAFDVEIGFDAGGLRLRSGMVAQASIAMDGTAPVVFLPPEALVDAVGREGAVFVVEGDIARRIGVRIVALTADRVGVSADGVEGARVVTAGAAYLRDGDRVVLVDSF